MIMVCLIQAAVDDIAHTLPGVQILLDRILYNRHSQPPAF